MSENLRMSLKKLIGQEIIMSSRFFGDANKLTKVVLRGVDMGGLWLESNQLTQKILQAFKIKVGTKTPIVFLPYNQIGVIFSALDLVSLSESSLGVEQS